MQLVVQYLTKAAIKLPSAGDNTRGSAARETASVGALQLGEDFAVTSIGHETAGWQCSFTA